LGAHNNNKFLKINNAGAYFNGTYAASLYDPGIGGRRADGI